MPTNMPPAPRSDAQMTTPQVVRSGPPVPTRLQLPGGYYDPDSATFDEMRPANVDALMTSTTPVAPRPALARSSS